MRAICKKAVALLLVAAMVMAHVTWVAADESAIAVDIVPISAEIEPIMAETAEPHRVPLALVIEELGGTAQWVEDENIVPFGGFIVATLGTDVYVFFLYSAEGLWNSLPIAIHHPITTVDSRAMIAMDDLMLMMDMSLGHLSMTINAAGAQIPMLMEMFGIVGLTMAIVDVNNDFTWVGGFGYADTTTGRPVTEDTLFHLASISKPMTAIAVMQLVEDGVLGLDDYVVDHLPNFRLQPSELHDGDYNNITVRMLLSHASGIHNDFVASGVMTLGAHYPHYMNYFLDLLATTTMLAPEGTMFTYNNNAFTLLGVLLAEVFTMDGTVFELYEQIMQQNIFGPLGMNMTTFTVNEDLLPYMAMPYLNAQTQDVFHFYNALPTGSLISNANDMARFMHAMLRGGELDGVRILQADTLAYMLTPVDFAFETGQTIMNLNAQPGIGFLSHTTFDGFVHTGHPGNMLHYHSDMIFCFDTGLGVFVSHNTTGGIGLLADSKTIQYNQKQALAHLNLHARCLGVI